MKKEHCFGGFYWLTNCYWSKQHNQIGMREARVFKTPDKNVYRTKCRFSCKNDAKTNQIVTLCIGNFCANSVVCLMESIKCLEKVLKLKVFFSRNSTIVVPQMAKFSEKTKSGPILISIAMERLCNRCPSFICIELRSLCCHLFEQTVEAKKKKLRTQIKKPNRMCIVYT